MSELFLSVFGVAAAIAIAFYCIGKAAGTRVALGRTYQAQIKSLTDAMDNVSLVLGKERERADFYKTICQKDVKDSLVTHEILGGMNDFLKELRGDVVELKSLEQSHYENIYFHTEYVYHIAGEILKASRTDDEAKEWMDKHFDEYRKDMEQTSEQASGHAARMRERFMKFGE